MASALHLLLAALAALSLVSAQGVPSTALQMQGAYQDPFYGGIMQLCVTEFDDSGVPRFQVDAVYSEAGVLRGKFVVNASLPANVLQFTGGYAEAGWPDDIPEDLVDEAGRAPSSTGLFKMWFDTNDDCLWGSMNTHDFSYFIDVPRTCRQAPVQQDKCARAADRGSSAFGCCFGGGDGLAGVWRTSLGDNMTFCEQAGFSGKGSYFIRGKPPGFISGAAVGYSAISEYTEAEPGEWGPSLMVLVGPDTLISWTFLHTINVSQLSNPLEHQVVTWTRDSTATATNASCYVNEFARAIGYSPVEEMPSSAAWHNVVASGLAVVLAALVALVL